MANQDVTGRAVAYFTSNCFYFPLSSSANFSSLLATAVHILAISLILLYVLLRGGGAVSVFTLLKDNL